MQADRQTDIVIAITRQLRIACFAPAPLAQIHVSLTASGVVQDRTQPTSCNGGVRTYTIL